MVARESILMHSILISFVTTIAKALRKPIILACTEVAWGIFFIESHHPVTLMISDYITKACNSQLSLTKLIHVEGKSIRKRGFPS